MKRYSLTCPFDYGKYKEEVRGQIAENVKIEEDNAELKVGDRKPVVAVTTLQKVMLSDLTCVEVALRKGVILLTKEAEDFLKNAKSIRERKAQTKKVLAEQKSSAPEKVEKLVDESTLVDSITISVPERIVVGEELDLNVEVSPIDADNTDVSITVSTACIEVAEEAITAKEAGECVITVAAVDGSDVVATAKVEVVEAVPVKEFVLVLPDKVEAGDKFEYGITLATDDGGAEVVLDEEPTVKFSNKRLAVTEDGKIEAVNVGPSVVTVTFVSEGEAVKLVGNVEVIAAE